MFGFIFGTACLIGLVKVVRYSRHGGGWHRGGGRRWMLRRLFYELETTPGQEKVIQEAIDSLDQHRSKIRSELSRSRETLANLIRSEGFDEAQVKGLFDKHDEIFEEVRSSVSESFKKIHEALTPEQRKRAADLLENPWGMRGGGCGGGRRFGGHCGASC